MGRQKQQGWEREAFAGVPEGSGDWRDYERAKRAVQRWADHEFLEGRTPPRDSDLRQAAKRWVGV